MYLVEGIACIFSGFKPVSLRRQKEFCMVSRLFLFA